VELFTERTLRVNYSLSSLSTPLWSARRLLDASRCPAAPSPPPLSPQLLWKRLQKDGWDSWLWLDEATSCRRSPEQEL